MKKHLFRLLCAIFAALTLLPSVTSALSPEERSLYRNSGIIFYDPNACLSLFGGNLNISGNTAEEKIWSGLISVGFTPEQAAGVMGNMAHESGFNPVRHEGSAKGRFWNNGGFNLLGNPGIAYGIGLIQWSFGRRINFLEYVKANDPGLNLYDYFYQPNTYSIGDADRFIALVGDEVANALYALSIQFLWDEMHGNSSYSKVFEQTSVDTATWIFLTHVERPGGTSLGMSLAAAMAAKPARFSSAQRIYEQYGSWAISGAGNICVDQSIPVSCPNFEGLISGGTSGATSSGQWSPEARRVVEIMQNCFPDAFSSMITYYSATGCHPDHAIDMMIANHRDPAVIAKTTQIVEWIQQNRAALGVTTIIYNVKINSLRDAAKGDIPFSQWRPYTRYGPNPDDTLGHRDHVHISIAPCNG